MHPSLDSDRVHVTVDMLIVSAHEGALELMLSRRKGPPYAGWWALPGRLIALDEPAEATVDRLMAEMLPIGDVYKEQLYTFSEVDRDPRGRVISVAHLVIVPWTRLQPALTGGLSLRPFGVRWEDGVLSLTGEGGTLSRGDLAFDHGRIIETGIARLRGKIDYSDIGFRFLSDPGAFTLSELQAVFEAVQGMRLDGSNFRRFIRARYEDTGRMTPTDREEKRGRGRPAAIYRLNEQKEARDNE